MSTTNLTYLFSGFAIGVSFATLLFALFNRR